MNKIIKWVMWALIAVGVVLTVFIFADFRKIGDPVNNILYWTYAMVAIALAAVLYGLVRDSVINPKNLIRIGIVLVGVVVIVGGAIALAPGTPAVGYIGAPVSDAELKLTDTILNLTYFSVCVAVLSILVSGVVGAIKNRK